MQFGLPIHSYPPRKNYSAVKASLFELLTIIALVAAGFIYKNQIPFLGGKSIRYTLLFLPISMALVYLFALKQGIFTKLSTNKFLIFIGDISAYTFLFHQMIIRYLNELASRITGHDLNPWILAVVAFILTIAASVIWDKLEKKRKNISWKLKRS